MTEAIQHYFNDVEDTEILSRKEEEELYGSLQDSHTREKILKSNLRIALKHANHYAKIYPNLELGDLIGEANMGLMKAMEKFDPSKGFRFSTYAEHWIKNCIREYIAKNSRIVKTPPSPFYLAIKARRLIAKGMSQEQVMGELDVNETQYKRITAILEKDVTIETNESDDLPQDRKVQLSSPSRKESGEDKLEAMERDALIIDLYKQCDALSRESRDCIKALYGLENQKALTIKELSERVGLSSSKIKSLRRQSLDALKKKLAKYQEEAC